MAALALAVLPSAAPAQQDTSISRGPPAAPGSAASSGSPAPTTSPAPAVSGPQQAVDPGVDRSKFFMFHASGIPTDTARADLTYCMNLAGRTGAPARTGYDPTASMGLIGALVGGAIHAIQDSAMVRRGRDASMRNCMHLHGYDRYAMAESDWNAMMRGPGATERMLAYITGPQPTTERLPA